MKKALICLALTMSSSICLGSEPQAGLWWSPSESGRGYSLDPQGQKMVVTTFAYDSSGRMQWYYSDGDLSNGGAHWCGQLLKFDAGQSLNGGYSGPPVNTGNDGSICIDLTSRVTGTLTLPGGRQVSIQRQNFGVGNPPQALLGTWAYVYQIGSAPFADVYSFTAIGSATSTGTGVVVDPVRTAGFEYQQSGTFAGQVVGFHFSSSGSVLDQYLYQLQMEEGRGDWIAPTTFNEYGMNAYKIATAGGFSKRTQPSTASADLEAKGASAPKAVTLDALAQQNPELGAIARRLWSVVQSMKR